jgi:hypothetical protein
MSVIKNILLVFSLLLFSIPYARGQDNKSVDCQPFTLAISIKNLDTGQVALAYFDCMNSPVSIVARLKNGTVNFSGNVNRATEGMLYTTRRPRTLDDSSIVRFIIEPAHLSLSCEISHSYAYNIKLTGSEAQLEKDKWYTENLPLLKEKDGLNNAIDLVYREKGDTAVRSIKLKTLFAKMDTCYNKIARQALIYTQAHANSEFSGYLLNRWRRKIATDSLRSHYLSLNYNVRAQLFW